MLTKHIKSLQHPLIKDFIKLRKDKAYRYQVKQVLIMGKKMVLELADRSFEYLICMNPENVKKIKTKALIITDEAIFQKITGLKNVEPYAAVLAMPENKTLKNKDYVLILDQIKDPGNMGTLFRSALALGFSGIILTKDSVDPFNDKALRAAKGATFHLPFIFMGKEQIFPFLQSSEFFLADLDGEDVENTSFTSPLALILSHESFGTNIWENAKKVRIDMSPKVDSLNVATSGAILMYLIKKQLRSSK